MKVPKALAQTIEKIRARAPDALAGPPDGPERIQAAEKCLGRPLPADYAAFLANVGRITWPREIGNVVDYRIADVEPRFVPFSPVVEGWCDGFVRDRPTARQLANLAQTERDLRESRAYRKELAASDDEEQRDDQNAYVAQLDDEIAGVRAKADALAKQRRPPAHLAIDAYKVETHELVSIDDDVTWTWSDPVPLRATDGAPQRIAFADWLARVVDEALAEEERERTRPAREAAKNAAERIAATEELPERARRRALALQGARNVVAWLRQTEKLEVQPDFDPDAAATQILPRVVERWFEGILDALTDRDDVVEVFADASELEEAWPTLVPDAD